MVSILIKKSYSFLLWSTPQIVALVLLSGCALYGPNKIEGIEMELAPFKSDGCSSYFNGDPFTAKNEWLHCCIAHDLFYWYGGTKAEKNAADHELKQCVSQASGKTHGELVELGVFVGGGPQTGLPWRWGYGWSIEVPYFSRGLRHFRALKKNLSSIEKEWIRWRHRLNLKQRNYVEKRISQFKSILN
jgi:hypothetical protein